MTADLQRQIDTGFDWAGYFFSMRHSTGEYECGFNVATYEYAARKPYLEIVPEPSSLMALGGGLVGLLGLVCRRR